MTGNLTIIYAAGALTLAVCSARGAEPKSIDPSKLPPASTQSGVTYAADIKPLFERSCTKCHGAEKPKGRLRLDSLPGVLKGGEDGKVVVPGDSAKSMLVHNIAHAGDPDAYMPPPRNKAGIKQLTKEEIGLIRAWIDQGAK